MHHRVGGVVGKGEDVAILRPVATKAVDAAVVIARALTPLPMQPGWHASLAFSRSVLPQGKDFRYSYQQEVRAAWLPPTADGSRPKLDHIFVTMGRLTDYCELIEL